jgi:hypothetical protein
LVVGEHCLAVTNEFVVANLLPNAAGFLPNEKVKIVVFDQRLMNKTLIRQPIE